MTGSYAIVYFFILILLAVLSSRCTSYVSAFQIRHQLQLISAPPSIRRTRYYHDASYKSIILLANSNIDDEDANRDADGEDLTGQFYKQLNKRQQESDTSNDDQSTIDLYTIGSNSNNKKIQQQPVRKFTGASSTSLFSNQQSTSSTSSNIQREREREYNLASRFERTFGLQVALLLFSLVFAISIGLSGGITDGSERNFYGDDIVDEIYVDRYRSDDAAEVEERIRQRSSQSSISSGMREEKSIPIKDDKVVDQVAKPTSSEGSYWL